MNDQTIIAYGVSAGVFGMIAGCCINFVLNVVVLFTCADVTDDCF